MHVSEYDHVLYSDNDKFSFSRVLLLEPHAMDAEESNGFKLVYFDRNVCSTLITYRNANLQQVSRPHMDHTTLM